MAIITVDTLTDVVDANDGVTSLREAILQANANPDADTILFDAALAGGTLQLTGQLTLETDITIDGDIDGDTIADISILGGGSERVFYMSDFDTDVTLNGLVISGGYDVNYGGNILAQEINSLTINHSTISGGYSGLYGGNIHAREVNSVTVMNSSIINGESYHGGGIAVDQLNGQSLNIINSLVANNTAELDFGLGGGVYVFGLETQGVTTIIGTTLTGNIASTGGGLSSIASDVSVHNSTVAGNEAAFLGGGLNVDEGDILVLTNSVVAENISTNGGLTPDIGGESALTAANSFFGTTVVITTDNGGNINTGGDAGLGVLGDYGGPVQTLLLESDSPLRGAGSTAVLPADIYDLDGDGDTAEAWSIDATGNSRVVETLDIGASEYTLSSQVVVSSLADENDGDYSFGNLSLREAINIVTDGGTITFDSSLAGGTIGLINGPLSTPRDVTIDGDVNGDNTADIILSGTNNYGILDFTAGSHVLTSLVFLNGSADAGGALNIAYGADVAASHLNFSSNFSNDIGGAINNNGDLSLINSTFASNVAANDGGAIYNTGVLSVTNSTFVQNQAGSNGGAIFAGGLETITSSTLTQNFAFYGGAISTVGPLAAIINSIVTGNQAEVQDADVRGSFVQFGGNIIGADIFDGTTIVGTTTAQDIFGDNVLADNGGTVQTLNLTVGSDARSAGDLTQLPTDAFDIDGDMDSAEALPLDANGESRSDDGALDLGAVEYIGPEFTGDLTDGQESLSFDESTPNGTFIFDVDANDGFGGADDSNISYSLSGNHDGDGDGSFAYAIDAAGIVTVNDADDLSNEYNFDGAFGVSVIADNGEASNATSAAFLDITITDLPETFTVTTVADVVDANDGLLSLREALSLADQGPAQDTILFDAALSGGTITLAGTSLDIVQDIIIQGDIDGDGNADITLDANGQSRVFTITAATELDGLNITGGVSADNGGGIFNDFGSTVTLTNSSVYGNAAITGGGIYTDGGFNIVNSTVANNSATGNGGGIYNASVLTLNTATLAGNSSGGDGGAIFSEDIFNFTVLDLINVTIAGNSAVGSGGAIFASDTNTVIDNTTVTGNTAGNQGNGIEFVNSLAQLNNTIVSGNGAGVGNQISGVYTANSSLIGGSAADIFADVDANGGGLLSDNGGSVQTVAILSSGDARNAGDASLLPSDSQDLDGDLDTSEALSLDANGNLRVLGTLDIGAVEFAGPVFEGALADGVESLVLNETEVQNAVLIDVNAANGLGGTTDVGISYSILSGNQNGAFAIDSATGVITLADPSAIDAEFGTRDFTLVVQADNGASTNNLASAELTISIDDVAETLVVTTLADVVDANDGLLSLREAVQGANNGEAQETILFDAALAGGMITLQSELALTQDIVIDGDVDGDNRADITISGDGLSTIFDVSGGVTDARLLSLSLTNATGAISANDASSLFVMDTTIEHSSSATAAAGAIASVNTDTVVANSLLRANTGDLAGGIYSSGGDLTLLNTTVIFNSSNTATGGISVASGNVEIFNSTLIYNTGATVGGIDAVGTVNFVNTAVTDNTGSSAADVQAGSVTATHSFFGTAVTITTDNGGNINNGGYAGLTDLLDRGASTLTLGVVPESVLIDAGSNAALPNDIYDIDEDGDTAEVLPTDGRGERIQNGTVDIGASELSAIETLVGTNTNDTITGSSNPDIIYGLAGDDVINAGAGDDEILGGTGNDTLDGGTGIDTAVFSGSVTGYGLSVSGGVITLTDNIGSGGTDTLTDIEQLSFADGSFAPILGTAGNDSPSATIGADFIILGGGDDSVNASNGDDYVFGGAGADIVIGGNGADYIDGGAGTDEARYANSNAGVMVDLSAGMTSGGHAEGDTLVSVENVYGSRFNDVLTGDAGDNVFIGFNGNDTLTGGEGTNSLIAGNGNDLFIGGAGADFLNGGSGQDTVDYSGSDARIEARLGGTQVFDGGFATGDSFQGLENIIGSDFGDTLVGNVRANVLTGNGGNDFLNGDSGNDTLLGGAGNDTIVGGLGQDTIDGGDGIDTLRYANANSRAVVNLETGAGTAGHSFGDSITNVENLFGSAFNDVFIGDAGDNVLNGGAGGVDRLTGGEGNDTLIGGTGNDRFIFTDNWDQDTITDFEDGNDLMDFRTVTGVDDISDLAISTDANGDAVISFGADTITLLGIDAADIDAGDFLF